jgi:hypothetical protein
MTIFLRNSLKINELDKKVLDTCRGDTLLF